MATALPQAALQAMITRAILDELRDYCAKRKISPETLEAQNHATCYCECAFPGWAAHIQGVQPVGGIMVVSLAVFNVSFGDGA